MEIQVKGHSGCHVDVVNENGQIYVYKSTADPKYLNRLLLQAKKQQEAYGVEYQHIRVPKIYELQEGEDRTIIKMQYVYSKNFIEFFEQAGFEQVDYLIEALKYFIEYEIGKSKLQTVTATVFKDKFAEIRSKVESSPIYEEREDVAKLMKQCLEYFDNMTDIEIPIGICHGDLTFSNILFNGNNYYLIDFLDSFVESPLQDIVKIRQDTAFRWSQLMYKKPYDAVRLKIICNKIDAEIDKYFRSQYEWYANHYNTMQLMNILRIFPYAHEGKVIDHLVQIIKTILEEKERNIQQVPTESCEKSDDTFSLIVPIAADKPEYEGKLPYVFNMASDGYMLCIKSIMGLNLDAIDHIYFTLLRKHDDAYSLQEMMNIQFRRLGIQNKVSIIVLDKPTYSQAETIDATLTKAGIKGAFMVKDGDSFFSATISKQNCICIYPLDALHRVNPQGKSYVSIDDGYFVTNMIEHRIISRYFGTGGYVFDSSNVFRKYYTPIKEEKGLYMSHIIFSMLLNNVNFRPVECHDYQDWGTAEDWKEKNY